jgi:hypothetical protein
VRTVDSTDYSRVGSMAVPTVGWKVGWKAYSKAAHSAVPTDAHWAGSWAGLWAASTAVQKAGLMAYQKADLKVVVMAFPMVGH